jgi:predicted kinase
MPYFLIVRGPLGVGKSTVTARLATRIGGTPISIDRILEEHELEEWEDGFLSPRSFVRANEHAAELGRPVLAAGRQVLFEGNFYFDAQLDDLVGRLRFRHYIFRLDAPLAVCIERDAHRRPPHGAQAAREVYAKSATVERGIGIDATLPLEDVVSEIVSHLPRG